MGVMLTETRLGNWGGGIVKAGGVQTLLDVGVGVGHHMKGVWLRDIVLGGFHMVCVCGRGYHCR